MHKRYIATAFMGYVREDDRYIRSDHIEIFNNWTVCLTHIPISSEILVNMLISKERFISEDISTCR